MNKVFLIVLAILIAAIPVHAQQSDTTTVRKKLNNEEQLLQPYHSERTVGNMVMPETGTFGVPEPTQYYTPPFMGQKYLEIALKAYPVEKMNEQSLLYQFINTIEPFINNQFQFAVYRIYDLPIVERDHPLLDPQFVERDSL